MPNNRSIKNIAIRAGRWTSLTSVIKSFIQLARISILARLLNLEDFGVMAVAIGIISITSVVSGSGLYSAIIHHERPDDKTLSSLFWANIATAILLSLILIYLAKPISDYYGNTEISDVIYILSLSLPISAFGLQARALAEKSVTFNRLSIIDISATIIAFLTTISLAHGGFGVLSLAIGSIASTATSALLPYFLLKGQPKIHLYVNFKKIKVFYHFGLFKTAEALTNTLTNQLDILIGSAGGDTALVGGYHATKDLSLRISKSLINPIVTRVGFPLMSSIQGDRNAIKSIYLRTMRITASINFPAYIILFLYSEAIVLVLLGEKWASAHTYLEIFSIWGLARSIGNITGSFLYATGNVKRALSWNICQLFFSVLLLSIGYRYAGLTGLAISLASLQILSIVPAWFFLIRPYCDIGLKEYIIQPLIPLIICTLAAMSSIWQPTFFKENLYALNTLISIITFSLIYISLSIVLNKATSILLLEALGIKNIKHPPK